MKVLLLLFAILLMPFAGLHAEEITTSDFAAGFYLEIEGAGPIHSMELPFEIYGTVRRPDLGDIRVFNGAGEVVAHGLRNLAPDPDVARQRQAVPFFPLSFGKVAAGQADMSMQVVRNTAGTIVSIKAGPEQGTGDRQVTGYLFDLSGLQWPVGELEFHWNPDQDSSLFNISLQHSNDLQHWSPLVAGATLVDLSHGGERVEKRTVPLPSRPQKYVRLTWQGRGSQLLLTQVDGLSEIIGSRLRRHWTDLANGVVHSTGKELTIDYETSSHLPVGSAQMHFRDKNQLARVVLQSRADAKDPWRRRCEQVFYNLSLADSPVRSEPCVFPTAADRFWRALVRTDGAGIGAGHQVPGLELGWRPIELVFVARGEPPFLLAFGSAKLEHQEGKTDSDMILQAVSAVAKNQAVDAARLGQRIELGGTKALQPLPQAPPLKKWLLWAILILGVGLLAGMARSLIKEMHAGEEKRTTENH